MNEEIKEILDKLSNRKQETLIQGLRECQLKNIKHPFITKEEYIDKILDYITNLQEENKKLHVYLKPEYIVDRIKNLEEENERLKYDLECLKMNFDNQLEYDEQLEDYKSRCEKAIELLKNKKEKYKNMIDYHQYYVEGYDKAIELTHSSHSGVMLETIKSTTIKNCDDLLNILQNGSDDNV